MRLHFHASIDESLIYKCRSHKYCRLTLGGGGFNMEKVVMGYEKMEYLVGIDEPCPTRFPLQLDRFNLIQTRIKWVSGLHEDFP